MALILGYAAVGLTAALWVVARQGRAGGWSALATLLLWPLWLPFAAPSAGRSRSAREDPEVACALEALEGCWRAARGTPLESSIDRASLEAMQADLRRIADRRTAIQCELEQLPPTSPSASRLASVRDRDARELEELTETAHLLRAEIVLGRHGMASDVRKLVGELRARVEGLQAAGTELEGAI
jgi:hypothetical protein